MSNDLNELLKKRNILTLKELMTRVKDSPEDPTTLKSLAQILWETGDRDTSERLFFQYGDPWRHRVEIQLLTNYDSNDLLDFSITTPAGSQFDIICLDITGWVLGRHRPVQSLSVVMDSKPLLQVPVCVPSINVQSKYPDVDWSSNCGFRAQVYLLEMPLEFSLTLNAVFSDNKSVPFAKLNVRRKKIMSSFSPSIHPLMVTSLGRMGTTWLMQILNAHPDIVIHSNYPYEARLLGYCFYKLKNYFSLFNFVGRLGPDEYIADQFGFHHPGTFKPIGYLHIDYQFQYLFNSIHANHMITAIQKSIQDYYTHLAQIQQKSRPVYFAEKMYPGNLQEQIWELYPKAKEIILVRDLRDVVCSVLSFNKKRGFDDFGRQCVSSDKEYITKQLKKHADRLLQSWLKRKDRCLLVHYEKLLMEPEENIKRILDYLGLDSSSETIDRLLIDSSKTQGISLIHITSNGIKNSIGRWKKDLSQELQLLSTKTFENYLKEFKYMDT